VQSNFRIARVSSETPGRWLINEMAFLVQLDHLRLADHSHERI
jgi:hypothetical protein